MRKIYSIFCALLLISIATPVIAQEAPTGFLVFPAPKQRPLHMSGNSHMGLAGEGADDPLFGNSPPNGEKEKDPQFVIYDLPDEKSEKIASVTTAGAMRVLRASTAYDMYNFDLSDNESERKAELRIWVFEQKKNWMRVRFLFQPPWNGRDGWIKQGSGGGTFSDAE